MMKILFSWCLLFICLTGAWGQISMKSPQKRHAPLDTLSVSVQEKGTVSVEDGKGQAYFTTETPATFQFQVAGKLGWHNIVLYDTKGRKKAKQAFWVDCESGVDDTSGKWHTLFEQFKFNHLKAIRTEKYQGEIVQMHEICPRNDANSIRGTQYIYPRLKDGVELFGKTQHEDGMIYDIIRWVDKNNSSTLEGRSTNTDHFVEIEDGWYYKQRFPVENDLEHFYVQWLWRAWKATGDTEWMRQWLPHAIKALRYSQENSLRWSEKYQLLKRGFTIDTWDFQPDHEGVRGDHMDIRADVTKFGVMHGDNTGYAWSCQLLGEMLRATDQPEKATNWEQTGKEVLERLKSLAWNGDYFYHFIPEDSSYQRDLGVDMAEQVSLSNALVLHRNLPEDMGTAILQTYRRIRQELPKDSPGEFMGIYPPITKGYSIKPYHYINGGAFAFIAGELAMGAFNLGQPTYGASIMEKVRKLMEEQNGQLPYYWIGREAKRPATQFTSISLAEHAEGEIAPHPFNNPESWVGPGPDYALRLLPKKQLVLDSIPFQLLDFAQNDGKAFVGIGQGEGYAPEVTIPINQKAKSLYLLHVLNGGGLAGWMTFHYADGSSKRQYVEAGKQINGWYFPKNVDYSRTSGWTCKMAWRGNNGYVATGVYAWGLNNPYPEKTIERLSFTHSGLGSKWLLYGITLSDQPKFFAPPPITRYYVNTGWNAGTFLSALVEGLGGIKNTGLAYGQVSISPQWYFVGEDAVTMTAKIPASDAYVRYRYEQPDANSLRLAVSSSSENLTLSLPIPKGKNVQAGTINGKSFDVQQLLQKGGHSYLKTNIRGKGAHVIEVSWE